MSSGFLISASNPKALLFFVGFLPAFLNLEAAAFSDIFIASIVIAAAFLAALSFYALMAVQISQKFKNEHIMLWLHRIAGIMLSGVGIFVIFS